MWFDVRSGKRQGNVFFDTPPRKRGEAFGHSMVFDCQYSPWDGIVAVALGSWHRKAEWGEVRLLDLASQKVISTPWAKANLWCQNVAFSHDGEMLCASTSGGDIMLWKVRRKEISD